MDFERFGLRPVTGRLSQQLFGLEQHVSTSAGTSPPLQPIDSPSTLHGGGGGFSVEGRRKRLRDEESPSSVGSTSTRTVTATLPHTVAAAADAAPDDPPVAAPVPARGGSRFSPITSEEEDDEVASSGIHSLLATARYHYDEDMDDNNEDSDEDDGERKREEINQPTATGNSSSRVVLDDQDVRREQGSDRASSATTSVAAAEDAAPAINCLSSLSTALSSTGDGLFWAFDVDPAQGEALCKSPIARAAIRMVPASLRGVNSSGVSFGFTKRPYCPIVLPRGVTSAQIAALSGLKVVFEGLEWILLRLNAHRVYLLLTVQLQDISMLKEVVSSKGTMFIVVAGHLTSRAVPMVRDGLVALQTKWLHASTSGFDGTRPAYAANLASSDAVRWGARGLQLRATLLQHHRGDHDV